jgi:hypothetical protein
MEIPPFSTLRRFAKPQTARRAAPERCEFCNAALAPEHRHLLEVSSRQVVCVCDPCGLRFHDVVGGRFKLIPRDARVLAGFQLSEEQWESLALPIGLAFFFYSTPNEKVTALYPSPAGATESLLPLAAWEAVVSDNPMLGRMQADVEALLAYHLGEKREYYLAPIDRCYELVGLIRLHWRGLSGGDAVWEEIDRFFSQLRTQASVLKDNHA